MTNETAKKVTENRGIDDILFTEVLGSTDYPGAVKGSAQHINGLDYVLWSAREAAQYRIGKQDPNAEHTLLTRTAVLYFVENGKTYAAFDDSPNPRENILLARAQEGYDAHTKTYSWFVPMNDTTISGALARAESSKRIIEVKVERYDWVYSVCPELGGSAFGNAPVNHMIFGADVAEPYSSWIYNHRGIQNSWNLFGCSFVLDGINVERSNLPSNMVDVRAVTLGGDDYHVNYVYALARLNDDGRSAGVASTPKNFQWK